jgi:DNA-binding NarL/FixJ family response regulator
MKVVVADDHRLMVEGIRRALECAEEIEIVGEASTGSQVLPLVRRLHPDVVLLDMRMPQMDGLTCLDQLRKNCPDVKVIVLSDPGRLQARRERLHRQERQPDRSAVGDQASGRGNGVPCRWAP